MKKEKSTRVLKIINKQDGKIVNEKHSMTYRIGGEKKSEINSRRNDPTFRRLTFRFRFF